MNRYAEYKDSGVEWIGKIPSHWEFGRMKYELSRNDSGVWGENLENYDEGTIVIRSTEISIDGKWNLSNPVSRSINASEFQKCQLKEGDIVVTKSSGSFKHIGKSVVVSKKIEGLNCCYSNFVQRIRFKRYLPILYHYILNSYFVREQYRFLTQSTTGLGNLDRSSLDEILLPFIPLNTQPQIAQFIDNKISQIDSLIEKIQRKIELLKEQKAAFISQCVTKGLDPNAEMKYSGVEWIGEIPSHWEVKRLATSVRDCINGVWGNEPDGVQDIVCVRVADFDRIKFRVSLKGSTIRSVPMKKRVGRVLEHGDLLLEKSGGGELQPVGVVILFNREFNAVCSNFIARIPVVSWCNSEFLTYLHAYLYTIRLNTRSIKQTTGIQNLDAYSYLNEHVAFPPLSEQDCLSQYLDKKTSQIDSLSEKLQRKIELLKEYRQSLISNVVTGKVKVTEDAS